MDEEQRKWQDQLQAHFGAKEFIRFGCAMMVWIFAGVAVSVAAQSETVFVIFFLAFILFAHISTRWKPAYGILRWILGNQDLPVGPLPQGAVKSLPRPWWSFLPGIWWLLISLILLLVVLRYLGY